MVTADREDAGFRAARHLLQLGHSRIGFLGDAVTRPKTTLRKLAGFRRALGEAKVPFSEAIVQDVTEFGFDGGRAAFQKLIERAPDITGLFCINDGMALGAIDAAKDLGRECPRDLSVVGFGDSPEGRHWRPKLTTIALSSARVASAAIQVILENRQQAGLGPRTILIPEELILRGSTAPLR